MSHLRRAGLLVFISLPFARAGEIVADDAIRRQALSAVFPNMSISRMAGKRIDDSQCLRGKNPSLCFPDALKDEAVYQIRGAAVDESERCASQDLTLDRSSEVRDARFKLYRLTSDHFVLAVQYRFAKSSPAMSCPSIGRLFLLNRDEHAFRVRQTFEFDTTHHHGVESLRFVDLANGRIAALAVESDWGGASTLGSTIFVFDLSNGRFDKIFETTARLFTALETEEQYLQELDLARTAAERGARFCFVKTTSAENDKWFDSPRVTHPCYPADRARR